MRPEISAATHVLGDRIRGLRKRRGLTLADLATAAGLSAGYISQIERNLAQPSIPALVAIAACLEVTVQWFFSGVGGGDPAESGYVVRAGSRLRINYDSGITDELLTPKLSSQVEMILCRLPPGSGSKQAYSHKGEEVGFVLSGVLDLWVGERQFRLCAGDSCSFASTEPHRYLNPGTEDCVIVWAISPPAF